MEVKNVKRLSNTRQLRDFARIASENQYRKILITRTNTVLSNPLKEAGWELIKAIPHKERTAKGEVYERNLFTIKDSRFKSDSFLDEVKRSYTDLINIYVKDDKQKLKVFDRNGVYLPTKKIGKNNPKAEQIKTDNQYRTMWN